MAASPMPCAVAVVVTSTLIPEQHVTRTWTIRNFKQVFDFSADNKSHLVEQLFIEMGGPPLFGTSDDFISFSWSLRRCDNNSGSMTSMWIELEPQANVGLLKNKSRSEWPLLYVDYSVSIKMNDGKFWTRESTSAKCIRGFNKITYGWSNCIFTSVEEMKPFLDSLEKGSLKLTLKLSAYLKELNQGINDKTTERVVQDASTALKDFQGEKRLSKILGSLLGDKKSSDVIISVVDTEDEEIGKFYCHSQILSARSSTFRDWLTLARECLSMEEEKSVMVLDDAPVEVVENFLTFLYTGRFKDKRRREGSDDPVWVEMLPKLTSMAVEHEVEDLVEFCDLNLHRAANKSNIAKILRLAKFYDFSVAQAKLREPKYLNLLADYVCEKASDSE